jgi:murein DD-endopeptidase MepM/ murein hydrolase activator NlpD
MSLMLTAGGAGVALPLVAAAGANAAPAATPAVTTAAASASAPAFQSATGQPAAAKPAAAKAAAESTYTVVSGDTLFKIAEAHDVEGGWLIIFDGNREVIGDNPNLIKPGQRLSLDASAATASKAKAEAEADAEPEAAPRAERSAERAEPEPAPEPQQEAAEAPAAAGFSAPVDAVPSTPYRASGAIWGSGYHTGVDFSAPAGATVKAVAPGTVVSAGWGGAYGNEVIIQHADGHYSQYAHLSALSVSTGQSVGAGEQVGLVGTTGNSTGPHLHFEIRTGQNYGSDIDPLAYLRGNGVSI